VVAVGADGVAEHHAMSILRYLDVVLLVVAAAPALLLGAPALGYGLGAGGWVVQRVIGATDWRLFRNVTGTSRIGARFVEAFGRIWLLAGAIVVAGVVGGRADGLTAAIVIFVAYTVAFAIRLVSGPPERGAP
jgi:hypothetical protein